ncbi:syndecan isoform X1 [Epargyreus clarus]|uniref:syndecan isoform X1 n=1 Tax=Epargyreus clarus TaxID=520877 RepID=UPI003C2EB377
MQLRIYLWLSCVALAGYVRATEDAVAGGTPTESTQVYVQRDDVFIDDDGSGLESDESSGSGWGPGPGPDDEDGRGSGDAPNAPEDDEDYVPTSTRTTVFSEPSYPDYPEVPINPDTPDNTASNTEPPILPPLVKQIDVDSPGVPSNNNQGNEGVDEPRGAGEEQPSRPDQTDISISGEDLNPSVDQDQSGTNIKTETRPADNVVFIMNAKPEDRATSFFAQPGILAAVIGGAVVGLLCAILVVMFIVYRMRKKDEGSYALDEPKRSPAAASYGKGHNNREFYA